MGDCGYLDKQDRFWFCGRVAHRVITAVGPMYTIPCEAIFNRHSAVFRSALVGIGRSGDQTPVIIVEPKRGHVPRGRRNREQLLDELRTLARSNSLTTSIHHFLLHRSMPVDIRHNAKIFREKLSIWANKKLSTSSMRSFSTRN
jgi:acyl-coenzyme A synthetase/AMP-(fatty) acid ligase